MRRGVVGVCSRLADLAQSIPWISRRVEGLVGGVILDRKGSHGRKLHADPGRLETRVKISEIRRC